MSVLWDGSQPHKTGSEKKLVLVRTTKAGLPIYFVVSLLEMAQFGGTDAESLKNVVDSVFEKKGNLPPLFCWMIILQKRSAQQPVVPMSKWEI